MITCMPFLRLNIIIKLNQIWENWKKLWKHLPMACVPTAFPGVSITQQKYGEHVFYFFPKTPRRKNGNDLLTLIIKILFARTVIKSTACASSVFLSTNRNMIFFGQFSKKDNNYHPIFPRLSSQIFTN